MRLTITRTSSSPDVTLGTLSINGIPRYVTVERPWLFNQRNISCIPKGEYWARVVSRENAGPRMQQIFPNVENFIVVDNVPGRSGIYFHPANKAEDVEGCIGVGIFFGELANEQGVFAPAVLDSTHALEQLIETLLNKKEDDYVLLDQSFLLTIT